MNLAQSFKSSKPWLIAFLVTATTLTGTKFIAQTEFKPSPDIEKTIYIPKKVTALGRLEPESEIINLFAPLALDGDRVTQLVVKQGDWLKTGDTVAILASRDQLQAALEEAETEVKVAQKKLAQILAGAKTGEIRAQTAKIAQLKAELAGQVTTQQATISRWQSEARTAKAEYERYESLFKDGAITQCQATPDRSFSVG